MRTLWHLAATLFALGSGCISGEYTTSPDLALPDMTTSDMTILDMLAVGSRDFSTSVDMTSVACDSLVSIGSGPYSPCQCKVNCLTSPIACVPQFTSLGNGSTESCNGKDDNCDGQVDNGAPINTAVDPALSLQSGSFSWDINCDGRIELLVFKSNAYRPVITSSASTCANTPATRDTACSALTQANCTATYLLCATTQVADNCGSSKLVYSCSYDMTNSICKSGISETLQIYCK